MTTEVTEHHEMVAGPTGGKQRQKIIEVTIDTDANGDGSITVPFAADGFNNELPRRGFPAKPWVTLDDAESDAAASVSNVTADSLDVDVSGSSTTDGTVTVRLQVCGVAHAQ